jgi:hypothetical protein
MMAATKIRNLIVMSSVNNCGRTEIAVSMTSKLGTLNGDTGAAIIRNLEA